MPNQHGKCIKKSSNKPKLGPVVLEIACVITWHQNQVRLSGGYGFYLK